MVDGLRTLNETHPKAYDKCRAAIARLALLGHELRRPEATICATTYMSCVSDWERSITAYFTSFMDEPFRSSCMA